ncbi:TetR/AcrR family transcriptional regulator [Aeromicrobium sp.]|uniref:TetR/AcrR family transcriptional regulator n=1 Tax=Aeromicrobium sp. TaxID=1871063 RepID=UPI0025C43D33|nr:TetR/AcrR family transcriptional regulator [Aeromicrobium sp.]MCK5892596.1 TetR family transcriptional regulator [Aeromicrobium sp.]
MTTSGIGRRRAQARREGNPTYLEKRRQMVQAAAVLFKEKGFEATTLADIGEAVGVDRASIYYYVESKKELLLEAVTGVSSLNLDLAKSLAGQQHLATAERIRMFILSTLRTYDENYPQVYVYIQENMAKVAPDDEPWAKEMARQVVEFESLIDELIREAIEDGTFRPGLDPRLTAKALWGMLNWTHRWHRPDGSTTVEQIAENFSEIFLAGVLAEPQES